MAYRPHRSKRKMNCFLSEAIQLNKNIYKVLGMTTKTNTWKQHNSFQFLGKAEVLFYSSLSGLQETVT